MIIVNIHEAKTRLSQLLIRICRYGKPVADIVPIQQTKINALIMHHEISSIKINYDPTAPMEKDEWP